jgi:hypothetical protein
MSNIAFNRQRFPLRRVSTGLWILFLTAVLGSLAAGCTALPSSDDPEKLTAEFTPDVGATVDVKNQPGVTPTKSLTLEPTLVIIPNATRSIETTVPSGNDLIETGQTIQTVEAAIQLVQQHFPEVADLEPNPTPKPFDNDQVFIVEANDGWNLVFRHGTGDCAVGCLSNYYWYYTVEHDGTIARVGQFSREFKSATNSYIETGEPHWGIPR